MMAATSTQKFLSRCLHENVVSLKIHALDPWTQHRITGFPVRSMKPTLRGQILKRRCLASSRRRASRSNRSSLPFSQVWSRELSGPLSSAVKLG